MTTTTFTATSKKDWQCYLDTPDYIVDAVNSMTNAILMTQDKPKSALARIFIVLDMFREYGFRDTECENVATNIVNTHFSELADIHRFDMYV